ncbi:hypothetical protein [Streptomyces sp. NPDC002215]|uniref:hypothetical protein n=1 Tax=Streptomyces sp. NPDC002215 TaxID=3154412 RepID=UPI003324E7D1
MSERIVTMPGSTDQFVLTERPASTLTDRYRPLPDGMDHTHLTVVPARTGAGAGRPSGPHDTSCLHRPPTSTSCGSWSTPAHRQRNLPRGAVTTTPAHAPHQTGILMPQPPGTASPHTPFAPAQTKERP